MASTHPDPLPTVGAGGAANRMVLRAAVNDQQIAVCVGAKGTGHGPAFDHGRQ
jgi:hypothetical protein